MPSPWDDDFPPSFDVGDPNGAHIHFDNTGVYVYDAAGHLVFKQGTDAQGTFVSADILNAALNQLNMNPNWVPVGGGAGIPAYVLNLPDAAVILDAYITAVGAASAHVPTLELAGPNTGHGSPLIDLVADDGSGLRTFMKLIASGVTIQLINNLLDVTATSGLSVHGSGGVNTDGVGNFGGPLIVGSNGGESLIENGLDVFSGAGTGDELHVTSGDPTYGISLLAAVNKAIRLFAHNLNGSELSVGTGNVTATEAGGSLKGLVTVGSGLTMARLASGNTSFTTNASGVATITHGLGATPAGVVVTCNGAASQIWATVSNVTSTTFDVTIWTPAGTSNNASRSVRWMCTNA